MKNTNTCSCNNDEAIRLNLTTKSCSKETVKCTVCPIPTNPTIEIDENCRCKHFDLKFLDFEHSGHTGFQHELTAGEGITISDDYVISVDNSEHRYSMAKVQEYLYEYECELTDADDAYAINYCEENFHNRENVENDSVSYGGCSSVRKGNFYGRNYDWYYNKNSTFVVHTKARQGINESIGISQVVLDEIDPKVWNEKYRLIPYFMLDGINEHGLFINNNVVPTGDFGITTGTHPELEGDGICQIILPKYILDHFATADEAVAWLRDSAKIYAIRNASVQIELHFMIGDANKTYIVEFINNEAVITDITTSGNKVMTNFYIEDTTYDENGHIDFDSVSNYGSGLERYNILVDAYNSVNSLESMRNCMDLVKYTQAYTEIYSDPVQKIVNPNTWKTEWAHDYSSSTVLPHPMDLHANSPLSDYEYSGILDVLYNMYQTRSRETGTTWQTVHSTVYDLEKREMYLVVQENGIEYHFVVPTIANLLKKIDEEKSRAITAEQEIKESIVWEAGEGEGSVITKINAKEGVGGSAKGAFAVSEGWGTVASGESSHTEGRMTMVIHTADCAHAEGNGTTAGGRASHTEGVGTVTSNMAEHAEGHYNKTNQATTVFGDAGNTLSSIGIGSGNLEIDQGRKNAFEVMQNGDAYLIGVGNYDGKNVSEANTLQEVISDKQDTLTAGRKIEIVDNTINSTITNVSELANDSNYQTESQVESLISTHNLDILAHPDIISKIPEQASETNKLADKNFVNSSIQTSTATFRGNFNTFASVPTDPTEYQGGTPDNNDYMVVSNDETHSNQTWRYKYIGEWSEYGKSGWSAEYKINDTPFTAAQLASLNSGATSELIEQITTNESDIVNLQNNKVNKSGDDITGTLRLIGESRANSRLHFVANNNNFIKVFPQNSANLLLIESSIDNDGGTYAFGFGNSATKAFYALNFGSSSVDLGTSLNKFGTTYTTKLNNGANLAIPTEGGTLARLEDIPEPLPDQTGQSGKFLTTDGTDASWANVYAMEIIDWEE